MRIERTSHPKQKPAVDDLGFGKYFSDHMLRVDWEAGKGWGEPAIVPYGPLLMDPAAAVLHYGQTIFEGFKAYASPVPGGLPRLFRPQANLTRLNSSARRLCMPEIDGAAVLEGVRALIRLDADWLPSEPGTAIYVRPLLFATEAFLGVRPSKSYTLLVMLSPVGRYWTGKPRMLRIKVETEQVRAARGGLGATKAGANYAASLQAGEHAKAEGFDQVLWLDPVNRTHVEEVGTMNIFFMINDVLVTPELSDSLLAGVTRRTLLELAKEWGIRFEERPVPMEELRRAAKEGTLQEVFGSGTAAVVSPVGELSWGDETLKSVHHDAPGPIAARFLKAVTEITRGGEDRHGWMVEC